MNSNIFLPNEKEEEHQHFNKNRLIFTPGIWMDGKTYWIRDSNEKLISEEAISIRIKEESIHSKVKFVNLYIRNHGTKVKKIKLLFMHHYPYASQEHFTFVSPAENVIFHIAKEFVFLVNGQYNNKGIGQMTIHPYWSINSDNIWSSIATGTLKYQPMAKGMMASIFSMDVELQANEIQKGSSWYISGKSKNELLLLNRALLKTH